MIYQNDQSDQPIPHVMRRMTWDRMKAATGAASGTNAGGKVRSPEFYKLTQAIEESKEARHK